jgi:hypothetical protein
MRPSYEHGEQTLPQVFGHQLAYPAMDLHNGKSNFEKHATISFIKEDVTYY